MKSLWLYIKHFLLVALLLVVAVVAFGISQHASLNYGEDPLAWKLGDEGPFLFFQHNQLHSLTIRGNREQGFAVETTVHPVTGPVPAVVQFHADNSSFAFDIDPTLYTPDVIYDDAQPILALSDLEANYATFRDFLLAHQVISADLSWRFGRGHLVLVGDFVDRGDASTQLLWLIYKLEQEARRAGGKVHYIIGNHELKNLQDNFASAADKYRAVAGILGKRQGDLFGADALLGRWLAGKNTVERINGVLFTHGGLHPELAERGWDLTQINHRIRQYYRQMYYPGVADADTELLISTDTGPAWYRGYFRDNLSQQAVQSVLDSFAANAIVVGHTLQFSVNRQYNGKVFAIDVKHPADYHSNFPPQRSEGLYIAEGKFYRALDTGEKTQF